MNLPKLCLLLLLSPLGLLAQYEKEAIEEVILEAYINGSYNVGIPRNIELGFSEEFRSMVLVEGDSVITSDYQDWLTQVRQAMANGSIPPPADQKVSLHYQRIDVIQDMAQVKLGFMRGNKHLRTEYLTLFHFSSGWKLVARTYQDLPQAQLK